MCVGLTFCEKWNTDNNLASEISIEDKLVKGLKLTFDALFAPQTGYALFASSLRLAGALVAVVIIIVIVTLVTVFMMLSVMKESLQECI